MPRRPPVYYGASFTRCWRLVWFPFIIRILVRTGRIYMAVPDIDEVVTEANTLRVRASALLGALRRLGCVEQHAGVDVQDFADRE